MKLRTLSLFLTFSVVPFLEAIDEYYAFLQLSAGVDVVSIDTVSGTWPGQIEASSLGASARVSSDLHTGLASDYYFATWLDQLDVEFPQGNQDANFISVFSFGISKTFAYQVSGFLSYFIPEYDGLKYALITAKLSAIDGGTLLDYAEQTTPNAHNIGSLVLDGNSTANSSLAVFDGSLEGLLNPGIYTFTAYGLVTSDSLGVLSNGQFELELQEVASAVPEAGSSFLLLLIGCSVILRFRRKS